MLLLVVLRLRCDLRIDLPFDLLVVEKRLDVTMAMVVRLLCYYGTCLEKKSIFYSFYSFFSTGISACWSQ